jgi:phosphopantothenoylcysteine decarboxylase / phosphopantothenate---cysteine ligase
MERSPEPVERFLNRKVLLAVTGSIAAFKAGHLVRELVKAGAQVQVIMTRAAHDFVTPLTLATLSGRPVLTDLFIRDGSGRWNDHVHLARWADVMLVAPASANTMSKMAHGLCDDLLLACFLSAACPVYVAPAMDLEMYRNPSVQGNLKRLQERGVRTIGPERGELASGLVGEGRMTEPQDIVEHLHKDLVAGSKLAGKRILVTAGPTQEPIDPVRYISNHSTGKMGFAIAREAAMRGARIVLVAGPVSIQLDTAGIERIDVVTAKEMAAVCHEHAPGCDVVIMSAAVADHRPAKPASAKLKKGAMEDRLTLEQTEDILESLGGKKHKGQLLVGFALETDNALINASKKLHAKNLDMLVLNSLQDEGAGFGHDTNRVALLMKSTDPQHFPLMSKTEVACIILDRLEELC